MADKSAADPDLTFKVIVIGDVGVGKSNISTRYCDDLFHTDVVPTLGMDFKYCRSSTLDSPPRPVRLQIWDTSGQDRFVSLTTTFYRNSQGVMLCFDLSNRSSFDNLEQWYKRIVENCQPSLPPVILVGCKLDLVSGGPQSKNTPDSGLMLPSPRAVEITEGEQWARTHQCMCYLETSAKSNWNVEEAFRHLATRVVQFVNSNGPAAGGSQGGRRPLKISRPSGNASEEGTGNQRSRCC